MRRKKRNFLTKRGVSPLIATVLLISFAVALASVVMNWGRNLDISSGDDQCSLVSLQIRDIGDQPSCYRATEDQLFIHFLVDNNGESDVEGVGIWIIGDRGTKLVDLDDISIPRGEIVDIKDKAIFYDLATDGTIQHIQIIPKVKSEKGIDICSRNFVKAENIRPC